MEDLNKILERALEFVSQAPSKHRNTRFEAFIKQNNFADNVHYALWHNVVMRSDDCLKKVNKQQIEMNSDEDQPGVCFCSFCCRYDQKEDHEPLTLNELYDQYLPIYPSYKYVESKDATKDQKRFDPMIHEYLVRKGILPKPLNLYETHSKIIDSILPVDMINHGYMNDFPKKGVLKMIQTQACSARVMIIIFCGHGSEDGSIELNDGCLQNQDIINCLVKSKFKGTVICIFNTCHAEHSLLESKGWDRSLPFKWVHIYSSSNETQIPAHALLVTQTVAKLFQEKPSYEDLHSCLERIWNDMYESTRGVQWRSPPTIRMGENYKGKFMELATTE